MGVSTLEYKWRSKIDRYGTCDINISPPAVNVFKNFCNRNGYHYHYVATDEDHFVYAVSNTRQGLINHENDR